ncbi:MAG: hypothetical protein ACM308_00025, partial [Qipengyuania vulgaris]
MRFTATTAGTYYIEAGSYNSLETGQYTLTLSETEQERLRFARLPFAKTPSRSILSLSLIPHSVHPADGQDGGAGGSHIFR